MELNGIERAISKAGGVNELAEAVGTRRQNVDYWIKTGVVSAGYVFAVADATGVPLHELNPAIYPKDRVRPVGEKR